MPDPEHVLRVQGRVIGRAPGGDQHATDGPRPQRGRDRLDRLGLGGQEARRDLGLLGDLVAEGHPLTAPERPRTK